MTVVSQLLLLTFSALCLLIYQYCIQQPETAIAFLAQSVRQRAIAFIVTDQGKCDRIQANPTVEIPARVWKTPHQAIVVVISGW
jgi:hypothetical protein